VERVHGVRLVEELTFPRDVFYGPTQKFDGTFFDRPGVSSLGHLHHDVRRVDSHNQTLAADPLTQALDSDPWSEADLKNLVLPLHLEKLRDVLCDHPLAPAGHDPPADPAEKARRHTKRLPQQPINKAQKPSLHHRFTLVRGRDLP